MTQITVNDKVIALDEEGFLLDLSDWSADLAMAMASTDDIALGDEHWLIIDFLQQYYQTYQIAPPIRILVKAVAKQLGKDKGNSRYLYHLFPYGPAKQGCRYAGLPKPTGCI